MNGVIKKLRSLSFVFSIFFLLPIGVYAATISGGNETAAPGDTVVINLNYASSGDSVAACNFDLNYDSSRLELSSVVLGSVGSTAAKQIATNTTSVGVEKVIVYGLNATVLGDGILAFATFNVKSGASDGAASVTFSNIVGSSPTAQAVAISASDCAIRVDGAAPTVTVTSPADGDVLASGTVTVEGTVDDFAITEVDVNGTTISVTDGAFSGDITLVEGVQTITVTAIDAAANSGVAALDVVIDLSAPNVTITAPNDGDAVTNGTVTVAGTVDDMSIAEVDINGTTVLVVDGIFSGAVSLGDGAQTLTVTATDAAGNNGVDTVAISVDSAAPVITIATPTDGSSQGTATVTVSGSVDDGEVTEVDINGETVALVAGGNFSKTMTLSEGDNTITITAVDSAGNSGSASVVVSFVLGDVNDDGVVSTSDADIVRDQVIQIIGTTAPADINNDGMVNVLDLQGVVNKL